MAFDEVGRSPPEADHRELSTGDTPDTGIALATVIVLYNPEASILDFVESMIAAGNRLILVVNAVATALLEGLSALRLDGLILNDTNLGLAHGFNQGIDCAAKLSMTHVMLLDQDSRPAATMGFQLARLLKDGRGGPMACIGPRIVDRKRPDANCLPLGRRVGTLLDVTTIISSGSVIPLDVVKIVGPMWDELFIDWLDHEWCLRAGALGYRICIAPDIMMEHDMGDGGIALLGRYRPLQRRPIRHYYIVRNALWLARRSYIPARWRIIETLKLLYRIPFYLLISTERGLSLRSIVRGLRDGVAK